jgi:uncharacterized protein (TIGR01319 family)
MSAALLIDFGSTWTKLRALDLDSRALMATAQGPSTVTTDINIGLDIALERLHAKLDRLPAFAYRLASSSAAGGLRMVTVGLVRELTAEAARQAALGAGARLCGSFAYRLTAADLARVEALAPDIVLLCGGTDGGNRDVIVHNARSLARSGVRCPVIVAGNREATDEAVAALSDGERFVMPAANVLPALDTLDIEPARAAIRDVFMRRIVSAKGIDRARARIDQVLMPTPAAVLEGARLLADGVEGREGLGPLVVIDPGGATTDVHSIGAGEPSEPGVLRYGLPEPYAKRTVEGDLGMRHSAAGVAAAVGLDALATNAGIASADAAQALSRIESNIEMLPRTDIERQLDDALVRTVVDIAMRRHAGTVETMYTAHGPVQLQRGKDLGNMGLLIGTGGPIVHARDPASILAGACADARNPASLRPRAPRLALDADYLLYAAGLLAQVDAVAAFDCARDHLRMLNGT